MGRNNLALAVMSNTIKISSLPVSCPVPAVRSLRSNVQWTLLGYFVFGACQWLMLLVVARMGLPEMVGQFSLAMALTAPVILLLGLELRTVQATDQSNQYSFGNLFYLRATTLAIAMLVIVAITIARGYPTETSLMIFVMGIAKCVEALSDLCHGTLQQHERLDQMAIAKMVRGGLSVITLALGLYAFQSLLLATTVLAAMWCAILVFYDWPIAARLRQDQGNSSALPRIRLREVWQLLIIVFPTGILACQSSLEQNLPRLCIEDYLGDRELGIFSAVSSLIVAVTLVINAIHTAVLPRISKYLVAEQWRAMWQMLIKLSLLGAVLGGMGTAAVAIFGRWLLGFAFGPEYAEQSSLLVVLMLGATARYATLPLSTGFRAAQQFWLLAILQMVALVISVPVLILLVREYGGLGAAYSTVVLAILFAVIQVPAAIWALRSPKSRQVGREQLPAASLHEAA